MDVMNFTNAEVDVCANRPHYRLSRLLALSLLALLATGEVACAEMPLATVSVATPYFGEYQVKAGFIYRFISFVSWPDEHLADGVITIGIIGDNPFGDAFNSVDGSSVGERVVRIRTLAADAAIEDIKACHILFVSLRDDDQLKALLDAIADSPVLTIGDSPGFIDKGGMVGFFKSKKRQIGIEINAAAANRAGLKIRSMLKRISARIIDEPTHKYNQRDGQDSPTLMAGCFARFARSCMSGLQIDRTRNRS